MGVVQLFSLLSIFKNLQPRLIISTIPASNFINMPKAADTDIGLIQAAVADAGRADG